MTGPFDVAVVANTYGYPTFGTQSLRISNAITSGSFGDQTFSKALVDEAGETSATNGGLSGGTRQAYFEASWDFASTVPGVEQAGLQVTASPDRGDGARMSWIQMADMPGGLAVNFYDYEKSLDNTCNGNFRLASVASGLDRTIPHNVKVTMQFVDGVSNDVVQVYVDGVLMHTGLSWEDYFRDCESPESRTVDSILFRGGGTAVPANSGNGFLIDNMTTYSGPVSQTVVEVSPANMNGWGFLQETAVASGSIVSGPATPPSGTGSAQLTVDGTGSELIGAGSFGGTYLRDINALTYHTYRQSGAANLAPALQFNIDYDLTDADTGWQGRLVYEPTYSGTDPSTGVWEMWNALSSTARWWASGAPGDSLCPQGPSCTWGEILLNFPNAGIHATLPGIGFKAGSGWTGGFVGNVDDFTIQLKGSSIRYNFENSPCQNLTQSTAHNTIQGAIDSANTNDVIQCNAGTYAENITVNKAISLIGAGSDCSDDSLNTVIQKAANLPIVTLAASGTAVNPLLLQDLCIHPQGVFGINIPNTSGTVANLTLDNVHVIGTNETNGTENEQGLVVNTTASLTDLVITDSAFDHLTYGWYFAKQVSPIGDTSTVARVTVTNTSFSDNDAKGLYVEKLSDATFTGGNVNNNGINTSFWNARWNGGFDINLKAGTYQNLVFDGINFTNNGLGVRDGVALMLKARDDGATYGANPATLTNVRIQNSTITGNERGIRLGEVGRSNAGPTNVTVSRNTLSNNVPTYGGADGSALGAVVLLANGNVTVKGNTINGNPQVFSQSLGTLTAYANNITNFTNAGLTSAVGTVNGRHNWWGTYASQPTGVDNDSWAFLLGAVVSTWTDGTGTVTLADGTAGANSSFAGNGTLVIVNHGSGLGNVPFGKGIPADTGASQCADFYDFFAIGGSGTYNVSIPVNGTICTSGDIDAKLFQFALNGSDAPDLACSPDTACWNTIAATRAGDVLTSTVDWTMLRGTPFAAPSANNNDPTAVSLATFSASTHSTGGITAVLALLLTLTGFALWKHRRA